MADYAPRLLPGMDCKSYPPEPRLIKEYEIFSGGVGNIAFDYDYSAPVDSCGSDPEAAPPPLGIPGLTAMQASGHPYPEADKEELHKLDYLPPAPLPKEEHLKKYLIIGSNVS